MKNQEIVLSFVKEGRKKVIDPGEYTLCKINRIKLIMTLCMYMLWFKFSFGVKFLELVQCLFSFVMYSLP